MRSSGDATATDEPASARSRRMTVGGHATELDRRFEAIVFDWDGIAVPNRASDAGTVRGLLEALCAAGIELVVVSGTHVGNVDGQLRARPAGRGRLLLALNRGSEVFEVDEAGPRLLERRHATPDEDAALSAAAELTVERLAAHGLATEIVSSRLNRRKVDLIPVPEWADPPKARIGALLESVTRRLADAGVAGLPEVVEIAYAAARDAGLDDPRVTSDAKHVEIGLTDKSDAARWLIDDFARRGIRPADVLVVGDEFGALGGLPGSDSLLLVPETEGVVAASVGPEPTGVPDGVVPLGGGPARFATLLADQLRRRAQLDLPVPDAGPAWTVAVSGAIDPRLERATATLLTVADGHVGTSGAPLLAHPATATRVLVAGVYDGDGPETHLLEGPIWSRLPGELPATAMLHRSLEMQTGVLHESIVTAGRTVRSTRFSSLAAPGTVVLRAAVHPSTDGDCAGWALVGPDGGPATPGTDGQAASLSVAASQGGIGAVATERWIVADDGSERVDRIGMIEGSGDELPDVTAIGARQAAAADQGFDALLSEHRAAWARRWADADVVIHGDDELQRAVRFALFHLMGSVGDRGEAGVGARGLTGPGYRGHVFWDADIFVLPFLAATHPESARAMIEYRLRRLPAAIATARARGLAGARVPWESARSGRDVTPPTAHDRAGRLVPIRTGLLEVHIVADVAWAAACYMDWTGDEVFARGDGAEILVETARFWASRIRLERDGTAHLYGVIGPDEYHEPVDDNAFTNVMARWNLRRAASAAGHGVDDDERNRWRTLADALVDGYDPETGVYEQFAGFNRLEPLIIAEVAPRRPIAADLLLGRDRVAASQVVKQADVLMLHQLVPEEVEPDSLAPNLRFYEPRTAHGSSLSPGVHASLHARVRDDERALENLDVAARIDLDDTTQTTAGGLHLATLGTVWQTLAFGFGGLRPTAGGALEIDPRLPARWAAFEIRVRFRGSRVHLRKERGSCTVTASAPVTIRAGGVEWPIGPSGQTFVRNGSRWEAA
jgi:trehalose/maltose hydrolase-like predicted phosphorylase